MNIVGKPCRTCQKPLQPQTETKRGKVIRRRNRGAGFCSPSCWYTFSRIVKLSKLKPIECPVCGTQFTRKGKTCSARCGYELRKRETSQKYVSVCIECSSTFRGQTRRAKFCSQECSRVHHAAMIEVECFTCGRPFQRRWGAVKRVKKNTCSRECAALSNSGENHPHWRGGHDPNRGSRWNKIAEEVRLRDNRACRRCRKTEEENGQKLSVDHIMPWRLFEAADVANQLDNLAALCRSCHAWKTSVAEKKMLLGDNIDFQQYLRSLNLE